MATPGSIFGLQSTQGKGKASLQTLGAKPLGDEEIDENGLPVSPFSNMLPASTLSGGKGAQAVGAINPANIAAGFQFTGEYDARNRGLQQAETDLGLRRTNTLAQIAAQFQEATRKAEQTKKKSQNQLYASLADKGALGSGAALQEVADFDTGYNDYLNDIAQSRAYAMTGAENDYISALNQIYRQREGLVSEQQQAEEARRLEEARLRAEAERQAREEAQRQEQLRQLLEAQEQARLAAEEAARQSAAARMAYSQPQQISISYGGGGGYDFGGGGGGGYQAPAPAPAPIPDAVVMPAFNNGVTRQAVEGWVRQNVDPNLTSNSTAMRKVIEVLSQAGPRGVSRNDLAWLIGQYPIARTPSRNTPYNAGGGVRVY